MVVATVVPQPVVHSTHTLLHPRSAVLHIHGEHLDCETEPVVQLNVPAIQGSDFTIASWNSSTISLSLQAGKDWLNHTLGSTPIKLVGFVCNQVNSKATTEVCMHLCCG